MEAMTLDPATVDLARRLLDALPHLTDDEAITAAMKIDGVYRADTQEQSA